MNKIRNVMIDIITHDKLHPIVSIVRILGSL